MPAWKRYRWRILAAALLGVVLVVVFLTVPGLGKEQIMNWIENLSAPAFVVSFVFLPLVGVPISIFLILAGLKFGIVNGLLVAAGCMLVHNVVAFWFTHSFLKQKITRFLGRLNYKIPEVPVKHQIWFTAAFTGIPGIPYTPKLYLLALTNVPFRIYLGIGWPIYSISNIFYIGLAGVFRDISWPWIVLLIVLGLGMVAISYWLKKRLDARLKD